MTAVRWGLPGNLGADLALLRRLRASGLLRGAGPLAALVAVRRAKQGEGDPRLVRGVRQAGSTAGRTHGVPAGRPA